MTSTSSNIHIFQEQQNIKNDKDCILIFNPLLELFANGNMKCPNSFEQFEKIFNIILDTLKKDPECFIKILKFQRLIQNDNRIKWLYYLCMLIIKMENQYVYEQILDLSWQCPNDFMNLHRITNMYEPITSNEFVTISLPIKGSLKGTYANKLNAWVLQNNGGKYISKTL